MHNEIQTKTMVVEEEETSVVSTEMKMLITFTTTTLQEPEEARLDAKAEAAAFASTVFPEAQLVATAIAKEDTTLNETSVLPDCTAEAAAQA